MKKITIVILCFITLICTCGCSKINFEDKVFICESNGNKYIYTFLSDSFINYQYIKNDNTIENYNCKYSIETNNMIKVNCKDEVKLMLYDRDNNCITDHNSRVYCFNH